MAGGEGQTDEWTQGGMVGGLVGHGEGWMEDRLCVGTDGRRGGWTVGWTDGAEDWSSVVLDGRTDGQGWMGLGRDKWMDSWMDRKKTRAMDG